MSELGPDITTIEASSKMGMNPQTLRLALQQRLFPFGEAVKTSESRYTYYINRERFEKYLRGDDLNVGR